MSRRGIAVAVAVAVTVVVSGVVLLVGVVSPPEIPALEDSGVELETAVAVLRAESDRECVVIVDAAGARREGRCLERWEASLLVDEDGRLLLSRPAAAGPVVTVLDPRTGEGGEQRLAPDRAPPPPARSGSDERAAVIDRLDGELVVTLVTEDTERVLARIPEVRGYHLRPGPWSPEGDWLLLLDSEDRILAVAADGRGPILVAESAREPVWIPPG